MVAPYYQDDLVTVYHGDCLEVTEWLAADVLVTDPPYGIGWKMGANPLRNSYAREGIRNDQDTSARDAALTAWGIRQAAVFGSWRAPAPVGVVQTLVWRKPSDAGIVGSVTGFKNDTELVFLTGKWPRKTAARSSVLATDVGRNYYMNGHPHAKPVSVLQEIVSATEGVVADPFSGSGSTLVAAASLGRRAIGVELEERYCELIAKRLSQQAFDFSVLV